MSRYRGEGVAIEMEMEMVWLEMMRGVTRDEMRGVARDGDGVARARDEMRVVEVDVEIKGVWLYPNMFCRHLPDARR